MTNDWLWQQFDDVPEMYQQWRRARNQERYETRIRAPYMAVTFQYKAGQGWQVVMEQPLEEATDAKFGDCRRQTIRRWIDWRLTKTKTAAIRRAVELAELIRRDDEADTIQIV